MNEEEFERGTGGTTSKEITGKKEFEEVRKALVEGVNLEKVVSYEKEELEKKNKVILFISFDLVNSSSYKTKNYSNWFHVIIKITEEIKKSVFERIDKAQLWRTIGDEAVFIVEITNEVQLRDAVQSAFEILNEKIKEIKNGNILNNNLFYDDGKKRKDEKKMFVAQNELSLKATAWIASVVKTSSNTSENTIDIYNLMYLYNNNGEEGLPTYEFQGNDIDTGFRLSKFTRERRLTLSIELAYILSKDQMVDSKINIMTYRSLKGIWDGKIYPIIWYHDSSKTHLKLEDSFFYDEYYTDDITKEFIDNKYSKVKFSNVNTSFQKLRKIAEDRNILNKVKDLEELLNKNNKSDKLINGNTYLEVHCVAIVVNREDNTVLMFRRAEKGGNHSGEWEFGFCQIHSGQTFKENIQKDYEEKFKIEIEVHNPIDDYAFIKHGKKVAGIYYIAELKDVSKIKLDENEYKEYELKKIDDVINDSNSEKYIDHEEYKKVLMSVKNYFQGKQSEDNKESKENQEEQITEEVEGGSK